MPVGHRTLPIGELLKKSERSCPVKRMGAACAGRIVRLLQSCWQGGKPLSSKPGERDTPRTAAIGARLDFFKNPAGSRHMIALPFKISAMARCMRREARCAESHVTARASNAGPATRGGRSPQQRLLDATRLLEAGRKRTDRLTTGPRIRRKTAGAFPIPRENQN